jgi:hypothetical protein
VKRARIVALGAKVVERGTMGGSAASEGAAEFAREHGHYFLDDASDPLVPAGTATIASEILDEIPAPDVIFVPMGDTALIRGVAAEAKRRLPGVRIIGVQAEQAPAYVRSWQQGRVVRTDTCDTIADGLATLHPLETNVIAIRELVDEVRLVSEQELLDAIRILLLDEHVVAEAAGAAATANAIVTYAQLFHLGIATGLIGTGFYVALVALFYMLFNPVSRSVSLVAAFFGLVGCAIQASGSVFQFFTLTNLGNGGTVSVFSSDELSGRAVGMLFLKLTHQVGNVALVFFGVYCLLIGCLILRSTFLPRFLGVLMVLAGLGWLIFLYPPLAERLFAYIAIVGITAEALLMLWLLVMGVNTERWQEQAAASKTLNS